MHETISDAIPLNWDDFVTEWGLWTILHESDLQPCDARFVGKNFMADEILGTWMIGGRMVELSTGTFPDLLDREHRRHHRFIGLTIAVDGDINNRAGGTADTWTELNEKLGITS